jgi:hypothetical protein
MRATLRLSIAILFAGCEAATLGPPAQCFAVAGDPVPTAETVCANLSRQGCFVDQCAAAYASYRTRVSPEEFARLGSCYARARNCDEVDQCERGCGPDGGAVRVGRPDSVDAGDTPRLDASVQDVPARDTAPSKDVVDSGNSDAPDADDFPTDLPSQD